MNKYAIFIMIMTVFSICYGMEKEPSFWDKCKGIFISKPQAKNASLINNIISDIYTEECPVCLMAYPTLELVQGNCGHSFCSSCIGKWLVGEKNKSKNSCPLCRKDVIRVESSQYDKQHIKSLEEKNITLQKRNNEQLIQINMLKPSAEQLKQKTEQLHDLASENAKLSAVIHAGVFLRCFVPLVLGKKLSLIAAIARSTSIGVGAGAVQILLLNSLSFSSSLYCQANRSKPFLNQFFLMSRIGRIGLWTAFFNSMLEMPWKQRLAISALAGAGLEAIDILLMQKTNDRRSESTPCSLVGLAGVGLGLGINTLATHLKLTGAIKDN